MIRAREAGYGYFRPFIKLNINRVEISWRSGDLNSKFVLATGRETFVFYLEFENKYVNMKLKRQINQ